MIVRNWGRGKGLSFVRGSENVEMERWVGTRFGVADKKLEEEIVMTGYSDFGRK